MQRLFYALREVIWTAVLAFVFTLAAVVIAIVWPDALTLVCGLGLGAVAMALLAQRA